MEDENIGIPAAFNKGPESGCRLFSYHRHNSHQENTQTAPMRGENGFLVDLQPHLIHFIW